MLVIFLTVEWTFKMNRIVEYYAKDHRSRKIDNANRTKLQRALGTEDVACVIDAKHLA
jgi:GTP cyclohydrolase I